jgi:putative membrane protein
MFAWNLAPMLLLGLALQVVAYLACTGPLRRFFPGSEPASPLQRQLFLLGSLALFVALVSPLDTLSSYLLSAHMVQHLLLALVAPPLMLLGTPRWLFRPLLRLPFAAPIGGLLTHPLFTFLLFNTVFIGWHVPSFYDLALRSEPVHILEHVMIFGTATLTWWPIFSPMDEFPRAHPLLQTAYLFFQSLPSTILGAIIAFANDPLYPHYTTVPRVWGIGVLEDQQAAGLIMWIPGSLVFFAIMTVVFIRWLNRDEREPQPV